jgi:predicted nucleotidyltransferase
MDRTILLERVKAGLSQAFGPRFRGLLLFGSEARGTARPDSDIDLLVLLDGKINMSADMMKVAEVIIPIEWDIEPARIIDATPANYDDYRTGKWPLFREVKKDGIAA